MGYIVPDINDSVCSGNLTVYWTDIGRQYLLGIKKPKNGSIPYYFSLSDCDKNYINDLNIEKGFVPDLTGDHTVCLLPTVSDIVRNQIETITVSDDNIPIIDFRNKKMPLCTNINNDVDCSYYYDMEVLNLSDPRTYELLGDSIWDCIIGDFEGTL